MYRDLRDKQELTEKEEEMVDQLRKGGDLGGIVEQAVAMSNAQEATMENMMAAHPINASDGSSDPTIDNMANSKAFCVTSRGEVAVEKDTSRLKNYCAEQKTQEALRKAMQNAQREAGKKEDTISLEAGQVAAGLENNSALKTGTTDTDDFMALRAQRMLQMKREHMMKSHWKSLGHGKLNLLPDEREFFDEMKKHERAVLAIHNVLISESASGGGSAGGSGVSASGYNARGSAGDGPGNNPRFSASSSALAAQTLRINGMSDNSASCSSTRKRQDPNMWIKEFLPRLAGKHMEAMFFHLLEEKAQFMLGMLDIPEGLPVLFLLRHGEVICRIGKSILQDPLLTETKLEKLLRSRDGIAVGNKKEEGSNYATSAKASDYPGGSSGQYFPKDAGRGGKGTGALLSEDEESENDDEDDGLHGRGSGRSWKQWMRGGL